MAAVDEGDLWSLAKRPLDLTWLVDYWRKDHRFGKFADMLETSIRERLVRCVRRWLCGSGLERRPRHYA